MAATPEDPVNPPPWYRPEIGPRLQEPTRALFQSYSNLSGQELIDHLHEIRDRSFKICPYPCIGRWSFLGPTISLSDAYETIVERLKNGQTILDVGCNMGQDLRRLAFDGVPTTNMYATDLMGEFWEIGYDLFRDRDTMKAHFMQADILDPHSALTALHGKIDILYVGSVLHLFIWAKQLEVCKQLVLLSKVDTVVLGRQLGMKDAEESTSRFSGNPVFWHSVESFKEMWRIVGEETGTRWTVKASLRGLEEVLGAETEDLAWMKPGCMLLEFLLTRTE